MVNVKKNKYVFRTIFLCLVLVLTTYLFSEDKLITISTSSMIDISTGTVSQEVIEQKPSDEKFSDEETELIDNLYDQLDSADVEIDGLEGEKEGSSNVSLDAEVTLVQEEDEVLETWLKNPFDLNTITYLQLKILPGMTPQVAREIIRHRRTKPFTNKRQLMSVKGMTNEIYEKVSPYITVKTQKQLKQDSKKVKSKIQFRTKISKPDNKDYVSLLSTSPLRNPIYYYNRAQLSLGTKLDLGYVFLYRPMEPKITYDLIQRFYLKKWWLRFYSLPLVDRITFGNYKAGFGYGLVFYENTTETLRPVKPKSRGIREDKSTTYNTNLYGVGVETVLGPIEAAIIFSNKKYLLGSTSINGNYINTDLLNIKNVDITFSTISKLGDDYENVLITALEQTSLTEQLLGLNLATNILGGRVGITCYESYFDKVFDPDKTVNSGYSKLVNKTAEYWSSVFRGNHLIVGGLYFEFPMTMFNIYGEYARSQSGGGKDVSGNDIITQEGSGLNIGILLPYKKINYYLLFTSLDATFYSPHGAYVKVHPDAENGQIGVRHGIEYNIDKLSLKFNYATADVSRTLWSGYSTSESPRYPSKYNEIMFESKYKLKKTELYFRLLDDVRERYIKLSNYNSSLPVDYAQVSRLNLRRRYQVSYNFTKELSARVRYDNRWQIFDLPAVDNSSYYGEILVISGKYTYSNLKFNVGYAIFDADKDVYLSYLEPQWYNVSISDTENTSAGDKFYFTVSSKMSKNIVVWFRYRYKHYTLKSGESTMLLTDLDKILNTIDHDIRFQLDFNF